MNLLIISTMPHFKKEEEIVGWAATVEEISHLSVLFDSIRHIACLHHDPAPEVTIPYSSSKIRLIPIPPTGGAGLGSKLQILRAIPSYCRIILMELKSADLVHVRCPANISLIAIVLLAFVRNPRIRWIKYAGSWVRYPGEAWSYKFQRWWLRHGLARAVVTINGVWPNQEDHIKSFLNPCLTGEELSVAARAARAKHDSGELRLLFVGRTEKAKGTDKVLEILAGLRIRGRDATLDVVGDGPARRKMEAMADALPIRNSVSFHGWLPRPSLAELYARAHFLLLPSDSEGWPKVISEAMAYGVIPIASDVGSISQILARFNVGSTCKPDDMPGFIDAMLRRCEDPAAWKEESLRAVRAAEYFTYEHYVSDVRSFIMKESPRA
jgi:glycosyltransferase involved in cell wall biosynthesis